MHTMMVSLEDDTMIEVPARKKEIRSRQIGPGPRPSIWIDEPLPHPVYNFTAVIGRWRAEPKNV